LYREPICDDDKPAPIGSVVAFLPDGLIDWYGGNDVIVAALRPAFEARGMDWTGRCAILGNPILIYCLDHA
jgi:hypothetical protein